MAPHITPIKYEALTPDCFLFLFRTTGVKGDNHYFVSLEVDHVSNFEGARCTIEDWHGKVIDFWVLDNRRATNKSDDIKDFQIATSGPYFAMLAEVGQPTHKGYWADAITIMPSDKISEKIKHYSDKVQANIRKTLVSILQHKVDPSASFLESLQAKKQDTIVDDINNTDLAVSIYVQPNDEIEVFYNYVHTKIGDRELKLK